MLGKGQGGRWQRSRGEGKDTGCEGARTCDPPCSLRAPSSGGMGAPNPCCAISFAEMSGFLSACWHCGAAAAPGGSSRGSASCGGSGGSGVGGAGGSGSGCGSDSTRCACCISLTSTAWEVCSACSRVINSSTCAQSGRLGLVGRGSARQSSFGAPPCCRAARKEGGCEAASGGMGGCALTSPPSVLLKAPSVSRSSASALCRLSSLSASSLTAARRVSSSCISCCLRSLLLAALCGGRVRSMRTPWMEARGGALARGRQGRRGSAVAHLAVGEDAAHFLGVHHHELLVGAAVGGRGALHLCGLSVLQPGSRGVARVAAAGQALEACASGRGPCVCGGENNACVRAESRDPGRVAALAHALRYVTEERTGVIVAAALALLDHPGAGKALSAHALALQVCTAHRALRGGRTGRSFSPPC